MSFSKCNRRAIFFVFTLSLLISTSYAQQTSGPWVNSTASSVSPTVSPPSSALESSVDSSVEQMSSHDVESKSSDVGDFIAAGMGMARSTDGTLVESPLSIILSSSTEREESTPVSASMSGPIITTPPTTIPSSTLDEEDTTTIFVTSRITRISIRPITKNHTISFAGNCWEQWSSYWSADSSASKAWTWIDTLTTASTYTASVWAYSGSVKDLSGTTTVTVKYGAFVQSTYTTFTETSNTYEIFTSSLITTRLTTNTRIDGSLALCFVNATIVQPDCVLPSHVPECQSSWENWLSRNYVPNPVRPPSGCDSSLPPPSCQAPLSSYWSMKSSASSVYQHITASLPSCTQAAITGALCSSVISEVLNYVKELNPHKDGAAVLDIATTYQTTEESNARTATIISNIWSWDPSSSVAPGCTLGCQSCQINGGTVKLIYWLPMSSTWIDGNYSAISGSSSEAVTTLTLSTTLTSPIVYISFDSLYARDSCSAFGTTHYNKIVAITNTANLSSLYGWNYRNGLGSTASFNFTDL